MKRTFAVAALALAACAPLSEEELITDAELDSIVSSRAGLVAEQAPIAEEPGAVQVRLAWGYFAGRRNAPGWVNWSGGAQLEGGAVKLEVLTYFDRHDRPVPTEEPDRVAWSSRTWPHFDGLVLTLRPSAAGQELKFVTEKYQRTVSVEALAAGLNERLTVDDDGHEVSISSVPARDCAGFSYGYEKPSLEGWLAFAGLFTNARGEIIGRLRFKASGEQISARLYRGNGDRPYDLGVEGAPFATGDGRLDTASGQFQLRLSTPEGSSVARVEGTFAAPTYSARGSYQAVVHCP